MDVPRDSGPPALQSDLFLDELHEPVHVVKVETFAVGHAVHGAAPVGDVALTVQRLVPDPNYERVGVALHAGLLVHLGRAFVVTTLDASVMGLRLRGVFRCVFQKGGERLSGQPVYDLGGRVELLVVGAELRIVSLTRFSMRPSSTLASSMVACRAITLWRTYLAGA